MKTENNIERIKIEFVILLAVLLSVFFASAQFEPSAPDNLSNKSIATPSPQTGSLINTSGGSLSNLTINMTTINKRWKGFVGNINGEFALQDSASNALFDWSINSISGEIYATRNSSTLNWDNITCANSTVVSDEESFFGITASNVDSINNTFNDTTHDGFYVGLVEITANNCPSIYLNVNNSKQSTDFQEVLLSDGPNLIYAAVLENSSYGFNNQTFDFQMIVAETAQEGSQPNTAYYIYVELI